MSKGSFDPRELHVVLDRAGRGEVVTGGAPFWEALASGETRIDGWLVSAGEATDDWSHWEVHPNGEEILVQLSGAVELVLEEDGVERVVILRAGQSVVVPRGAWHRMVVLERGTTLFVTYGEGTQHRPVARSVTRE